ncbi:hypothetical protein Tco_0073572 [Tanacetum coccineum]
MSITIQSSVKDKILATSSETSKVENTPAEMLRDMDQQMEKRAVNGCTLWIKLYSKYEYEIRYHPGKANVVIEALRRKERVKPRRVRAMAMTIQYGVRGMILAAQSEAFKQENGMMRTVVMDEAHASRLRWMIYLVVLADAAESVRDTIGFEYCLASSSGWTKSPVLWAEIGESSLTGPELVLDMTDKVVLIKEKLKAARDRQKSYADNRRKPLEFEVGDRVMLKVSPWKGVIRFGKKGKLAPRYVGPFEILERVGPVAYRLRLPEELSGIKVDKTLRFVEEPVENSDREVKRLKCSRMVVVKAKWLAVRYLVKVSWNSKCNFELTWVWEDYLKDKYPRFIVKDIHEKDKRKLKRQSQVRDEKTRKKKKNSKPKSTPTKSSQSKVNLQLQGLKLPKVSVGGEIPSAVEEHVNTASADITDIGVSTAAPESVNAADESQIEKKVVEVVTIAKIIVEVSKDPAAKVISTAGTMPVSTVNIEDLSTADTKVSAAEPVTTAIEEDTEEILAAFLTSLKSSKSQGKRLKKELSDAELAAKLHVEELERVRLEEERIVKAAEDLKAQRDVFDDVKSQIGKDIGDSTDAPELVNAADENVSKDAAAEVISTAGTMPVSTVNTEDLSTAGSPKPSKPKEKGVTLREPTETAKSPELPKIAPEDKGKGNLEESENPKKIKQLRL